MKKDGTFLVFIRVTHERKVRYIPTDMFITKSQLTASGKIKNMQVVEACDDIIATYRKRAMKLNLQIADCTIEQLIKCITTVPTDGCIDFVSFARKWCSEHTEIKGIKNYLSAINSLCNYFGSDKIDINLNSATLLKL